MSELEQSKPSPTEQQAAIAEQPAVVEPKWATETAGDVVTVHLGTRVKRYQNLSTMPTGVGIGKVPIVRCSAMLANHMQCWRAGDFYISDVSDIVNTAYQKCRAHAQQERDEDEAQIKAVQPPPAPEQLPNQ
jgi:hypothetical protein